MAKLNRWLSFERREHNIVCHRDSSTTNQKQSTLVSWVMK